MSFRPCGQGSSVSSQTNRRQSIIIINHNNNPTASCCSSSSSSSFPASALDDGTLHWRVVMSSFLNCCCCWWSHKRGVELSHLPWQAGRQWTTTTYRWSWCYQHLGPHHIPAGYHHRFFYPPSLLSQWWWCNFSYFIGLALVGKDIVFRLIYRVLGCRAHIFPLMALKGWRGEGSSQSRITESSMCGHQLFYISR